MRGVSESSPTRAMAEDLDVEAMLEAPYKKGVSFISLLNFIPVFWILFSLSLTFYLVAIIFRLAHARELHYLDVSRQTIFFSSLFLYIYIYRCTYSSRTRERESTYISFVLFFHSLLLLSIYLSLSMCDIWIVYTCICVEQSTPLSLMYKLLINTSIFCTYRWYVTCTLALVGRSPASS